MPMKYFFTLEKKSPSEETINIIKQIAYTYRAIKTNGNVEMICLN